MSTDIVKKPSKQEVLKNASKESKKEADGSKSTFSGKTHAEVSGKVEVKATKETVAAQTEAKPKVEKPVAGEVKVKKVEPKPLKLRVEAPPNPTVRIGDVVNPIVDSNRLKRALCVAIACVIAKHGKKPDDHADEIAKLCRNVGIVKRLGFTESEAEKAVNLKDNELSGIGYAKRTAIKLYNEGYQDKHDDKVTACTPFAEAAIKAYYPALVG